MEVLIEKLIIYSLVAIFLIVIVLIYLRKQKRESLIVEEKIAIAKEEGLHEPMSLHPVIDVNSCIKSGACISACPEKDIIGIKNGKATIINASHCIGHGACFNACPVQAITLCIGTEKRGVDLPHVNQTFETNVPGVFISGEIGGMGLIKNAVEQGKQAVENLVKGINRNIEAQYDLIIVGAGPAGISASLAAKKHNITALTLEQDTLGGTVFTFPRSKIVMTSSMDLPLHGKVRLNETSKLHLLNLWNEVLSKNNITIKENSKVESVSPVDKHFVVKTLSGEEYTSRKILLAIGRRGTPRKLNIPGEESSKVAYRLLEPELVTGKEIVVVGGGDSAIETALLLADQNNVHLSYRSEVFGRLKPKNNEKIKAAISEGNIKVLYNSSLTSIEEESVKIVIKGSDQELILKNDLVYIFAGGELPTQFLEKIGIQIRTKYGEAILKHRK
jgi:thioredoxin reductase/Pyruvate/2-oxoacid:ferredoxin oxidoreductase delta subunit